MENLIIFRVSAGGEMRDLLPALKWEGEYAERRTAYEVSVSKLE